MNRGRIGLLGITSFRYGYMTLRQSSSEISQKATFTPPPKNNVYNTLIVRQESFRKLSQQPAVTPDPPRSNAVDNVYETDRIVNQYMAFHYAEEKDYFKYDFGPKDHLGFPLRCAKLCIEHMTVGMK